MKITVRYEIDPTQVRDAEGSLQEALDARDKLENPTRKQLDELRERGKRFRTTDKLLRQFSESEIKFSPGHPAVLQLVIEDPSSEVARLLIDRRICKLPNYVTGIQIQARGVPPLLKTGIYRKDRCYVVVAVDEDSPQRGRILSIQVSGSGQSEPRLALIGEWLRGASDVLRASVGLPIGKEPEDFSAALPKSDKK
jgi:hypothetical protein